MHKFRTCIELNVEHKLNQAEWLLAAHCHVLVSDYISMSRAQVCCKMSCVPPCVCGIQSGAWVPRQVILVAAANIDEPGTGVSASTLHNTFGFDGELESKLDFSKTTDQKVAELIGLQLLLIDEVSTLDVDIVASVLSFWPLFVSGLSYSPRGGVHSSCW